MQLGLLESLWPARTPNTVERALEFHVRRFARWLNIAGAEPRLALILCAGTRAKARLTDLLEADDIEVCPLAVTDARPLPRDILEHTGDHFNRRLFLVDGFENCDRREVLRTLNGQRSQLRKMATWVGLVIESPETLATLYEVGSGLVADVMRRCLVVSIDDDSPAHISAPATQLNQWRARGAIAEIAFHTACTRGETADYHDISRLFRTGYGFGLPSPWSPLLTSCLGVSTAEANRPPEDASLDILSAFARHADPPQSARVWMERELSGRPFCRLAGGFNPQNAAEKLVIEASCTPQKVAETPRSIGPLIQETWSNAIWARVAGQLAAAQVAASKGDVEACGDALDALVEQAGAPRVAPEVYFNALEYRVRFDVGLSRRAEARAMLDHLEILAPNIQSPLYDARTCMARGDFIVALDPVMANEEYREAERLFSAHGYSDWADHAMRRQEKIR